jgi:hypothetical protein
MTRPSPKRKPVITGLEMKSAIPPRCRTPAVTNTTAVTSARAADKAAKRAAFPSARPPTAAAETAAVAVVAPTTSWREVPSSA